MAKKLISKFTLILGLLIQTGSAVQIGTSELNVRR